MNVALGLAGGRRASAGAELDGFGMLVGVVCGQGKRASRLESCVPLLPGMWDPGRERSSCTSGYLGKHACQVSRWLQPWLAWPCTERRPRKASEMA